MNDQRALTDSQAAQLTRWN